MKSIIIIFIFILGCKGATENQAEDEYKSDINIVTKSNLTESEFKEAIIDHWVNQFELAGYKNVETLDISRKGTAKVVISQSSIKEEYSGDFDINLLRPYSEGSVNFAEMIVKTDNENLVLSRLWFGNNNALSMEDALFLRINVNQEPYGTMKRKD